MIAELRELLAAATPGPWRDSGHMGGVVSDDPTFAAEFKLRAGEDTFRAYDGALVLESCEARDRALIVAAVNALPQLLALADTMQLEFLKLQLDANEKALDTLMLWARGQQVEWDEVEIAYALVEALRG